MADRTTPTGVEDRFVTTIRESTNSRMTDHEISFMLATATRIPSLFLAAKSQIETDLFGPHEANYVLYWRSVVAAAAVNKGGLPQDPVAARELIALKASAEVKSDQGRTYYTPAVEDAVCNPDDGLIVQVFKLPADTSLEAAGFDLLAKFITEREANDPLRQAFAGMSAGETLIDTTGIINILEKHRAKISGLKRDPGSDIFEDLGDELPPGPNIFTTGLSCLDELMNGGQATQECYVMLAPTGAGKTAIGCQIAIEGAMIQSAIAADQGPDKAGNWYYFSWELNKKQVQPRVYGYTARIHADTFKVDHFNPSGRRFSTADDPTSLKEYEYDPFVNSPGNPVRGERERYREMMMKMSGYNCRFKFVDYSGEEHGCGMGGLEEAVAYVHREASRGKVISGVVLDWAGHCVKRYLSAKGAKSSEEYSMLDSFVDHARFRIAVPMNCPVWVFHQLHGDHTASSNPTVAHHSAARGARNFADAADFAIQMTKYNDATGMLSMKATKHRRAPGREDPVLVRFDGRFGAFRTPDDSYVIEKGTGRIVPKDAYDSFEVRKVSSRRAVDPRITID